MPDIFLRNNATPGDRRSNRLHPTELKRPDGGYVVGAGGHLNAGDKKDLLSTIAYLHQAMSDGQVRAGYSEESEAETKKLRKARREALTAAYLDNAAGNRGWQEIGDAIGNDIYETANREGFMRRLFKRFDLQLGQEPKVRFTFKQNYAVAASSAAQIQPLIHRNRWLYPPEFYVVDYIIVEDRDIYQSSDDIMEEKLTEAEEAMMVQEDKIWRSLALGMVGIQNQQINVVGSFSPQAFQLARTQLVGFNLTADTFLFASDVMGDFIANSAFTQFYDPVSQYDIVQTGLIGRLLGINIISDSYRVPQLKVLSQGEMYMVTRPDYHGGYTDRGPVVANEIDNKANGNGSPSRGWYLSELLSMVLANPRSFVRITRM